MAAFDVGDDGERILAAGVVRRHDGVVGLEGLAPHDGALARVAVAAAAEHADRASGRERDDGAERLLERVGRVGVVDEH